MLSRRSLLSYGGIDRSTRTWMLTDYLCDFLKLLVMAASVVQWRQTSEGTRELFRKESLDCCLEFTLFFGAGGMFHKFPKSFLFHIYVVPRDSAHAVSIGFFQRAPTRFFPEFRGHDHTTQLRRLRFRNGNHQRLYRCVGR